MCEKGAVIVALLFEAFLVDETLVDVFDATLLSRHQEALLSPSRTIFPAASNSVKALGPPTAKAVYGPFSFRQIAEFVLFLPLNFIPLVGVPLFLLITGRRGGPLQHWRYFKLKGLARKERNKEVKSRRWGYTWYVILSQESLRQGRQGELFLSDTKPLRDFTLTLDP